MELEHEFTIPVPVDKAWPVLLDIRRIAPCMPGAAVDTVDGDDFTGSVKVKLGPINLTYKGQAKFVEKDEKSHKAIIDARGRDSRGNGTAAAKITATLDDRGQETLVKVVTDLNITGKPAQFGRGVMVDVGNKLIGQFADCLAGKLAEDDSVDTAADTAAAATTASGAADKTPTSTIPAATTAQADADKSQADAEKTGDAARTAAQSSADKQAAVSATPKTAPAKPAPAAEPEPIDLIELAGGTVLKKAIPAVIAALIAALIALVVIKKKH